MAKEKAPELGGTGAGDAYEHISSKERRQSSNTEKALFDEWFKESQKISAADDFEWSQLTGELEGQRQRAWWFILYPESMNPKLLDILSESGVQAALSPLHDRDRWPDGSVKKTHLHGIIYQHGKTTKAALEAFVKMLGGVRLQPCVNLVGACRYLAHMDIDPERIEGDRGKVRYSPDDIMTFGGFDVQAYLKATATQISNALKELYVIIREQDITAYHTFVDYIYTVHPEYCFVMSNHHVCSQCSMYIRSRYASKHKNDSLTRMEDALEMQEREIDKLMGAHAQLLDIMEKKEGINHDNR